MVDGFQEMSDALTSWRSTQPRPRPRRADPRCRFRLPRLREADPSRFSLLFGLPNPDFGRHSEHSSGPAAGATMASLERLVQSVVEHGTVPTPLVHDVGPTWKSEAGTTGRNAATARASRRLIPGAAALPRRIRRIRLRPRELRSPQLDQRAIARRALRSADRAAHPCDGRERHPRG